MATDKSLKVPACTENWEHVVLTALLTSNAIFKIFSVGTVSNLGLIKKVKLDESSKKTKKNPNQTNQPNKKPHNSFKEIFNGEC